MFIFQEFMDQLSFSLILAPKNIFNIFKKNTSQMNYNV